MSVSKNLGTTIQNINDAQSVPAVDAADNTLMSDVVGNKNDTTSGDSLVALARNNFQETEFVEHHFHHKSRTFGQSADQSGNNWATEDRIVPFTATSGNGDYGSDPGDEAKLFGPDDTPFITGHVSFNPGRIVVSNVSVISVFIMRIVWGDSIAAGVAAGQYSTAPGKFDPTNPQQSANLIIDINTPKIPVGTKVWLQVKSNTDNATLNFFTVAHGYALEGI